MTAPNPDDRPETMLRRIDFDTAPEPVTNADEFDTDKLPVQQYLVLEVLAARYRTGEVTWTFPTRVRWALLHLAELGLIGYKSGVAPRTYLAWLTEAGKASAMSETYEPPVGRLVPPDADTRVEWAVRWPAIDLDPTDLRPQRGPDPEQYVRSVVARHPGTELYRRSTSTWDGWTLVGPWVPVPTTPDGQGANLVDFDHDPDCGCTPPCGHGTYRATPGASVPTTKETP